MSLKLENCRKVDIEEAIRLLINNPDGFCEFYRNGKLHRRAGLYRKLMYSDYMERVDISSVDEYGLSSRLIELLHTTQLYTQTDEYLNAVEA